MKKVSVFERTRLDKGNVSIRLIHVRYILWQLIDKAIHNSENALRDHFSSDEGLSFCGWYSSTGGADAFFHG